ncbi:MAG: ABC transporter permease [Pirellulales bacterium]|nr:ABC transporter permease [Pirellulales bacterium]
MTNDQPALSRASTLRRVWADLPFHCAVFGLAGLYLFLIVCLVIADARYAGFRDVYEILGDPDIQASVRLTFLTCTISALLSVLFAVPIGYVLSRRRFVGRNVIDVIVDIPIILPPLVIGLCLLILFNQISLFGGTIEDWAAYLFGWLRLFRADVRPGVTFKVPAVILAQFTVACAFAIRTMKNTFDQISTRQEDVARTLGCSRSQTFWWVLLPQAWRGVLTGGTLAWARSLGEFGPILVFAGAVRGRTEVLSTSVFLEINIGNLKGAAAVSLLMITLALLVIFFVRIVGERSLFVLRRSGTYRA